MADPGNKGPQLHDYAEDLGLPADFCDRVADKSDLVSKVLEAHAEALHPTKRVSGRMPRGRKFVTALLLSFVSVAEDLLQQVGEESLPDALGNYPPLAGPDINTLTIEGPAGRVGLRSFYNAAERVIHAELHRSYPNMAPHATQAWQQHREQLEQVFAMSPGERLALTEELWEVVVDLPELVGRKGIEVMPRPFEIVFEGFATSTGEPPGLILQALAYAYFAADLGRTLQLESGKVGQGGSRRERVGDVDGWEGAELAFSSEVKDKSIDRGNVSDFAVWLNHLSGYPNTLAIAVGREFTVDAVEELAGSGALPLDKRRMLESIRLWDVTKQALALRAFEFYLLRIQRHAGAYERFQTFVEEKKLEF